MGETAQLSLALKNIGRISVNLGEVPPNREKPWLSIERISPKTEEICPEFLWAKLNCAGFARSPEKIITVWNLETSKPLIN
jgi:hypothetical protein